MKALNRQQQNDQTCMHGSFIMSCALVHNVSNNTGAFQSLIIIATYTYVHTPPISNNIKLLQIIIQYYYSLYKSQENVIICTVLDLRIITSLSFPTTATDG